MAKFGFTITNQPKGTWVLAHGSPEEITLNATRQPVDVHIGQMSCCPSSAYQGSRLASGVVLFRLPPGHALWIRIPRDESGESPQ